MFDYCLIAQCILNLDSRLGVYSLFISEYSKQVLLLYPALRLGAWHHGVAVMP